MLSALRTLREATAGSEYENRLWLVGGYVRDELLGRNAPGDVDIVTESDAVRLASWLYERGASAPPVVYPRFGTAMVRVQGVNVELVSARRESYESHSRKPSVEPASLLDDARRRDFTANALMRNLHSGQLYDPLGVGQSDLEAKLLRTPLDPAATFHDDPLRMLRAVRFVWQLGFSPAPGLYEAIRVEARRLAVISAERIQGELNKMLLLPDADRALRDLMDTGQIPVFAPELEAMVGVTQGSYHHLDVWSHSLLVLRNAGSGDLLLSLAALLHDIGKPQTRFVDEHGNIRFFGHEGVGEKMAKELLGRLKYPGDTIGKVALLVKNHMRLGSAPELTPAAARRLVRDLNGELERLLALVEADAAGLAPGVRRLDLSQIQAEVARVRIATPREMLDSPLTGEEIMALTGLGAGPEIGRLKHALQEMVLEGELAPSDKAQAKEAVLRLLG